MPIIRVPIPNKVAWYLNIIFACFLGIAGFFVAFTVNDTTRVETILLVLASLAEFYFLRWMIAYKWNPWGWGSLPEIAWNIAGLFTMVEVAKAAFLFYISVKIF